MMADVKGISATRQFIMDYHVGSEKLLMFDDDLKFATRRHDDPTKFRPSSAADVEEMLDLLWGALDDAAVVGLASRGGANRETAPWRVNQRLFDVMGFRVDILHEEGFRYRQQFMEDFDLQLQFLTHGFPTVMLNSYTKDDFGSNTEGGCSAYRDAHGQMMASLELWENWPDFVGIRKVKSTWDTIGERYDVTVYWSKAFKAGQKWRATNRLGPVTVPGWVDETSLL